jgi:hypothetical protein
MKRHDTDFVSFIGGMLFTALGVAFALDAAGTYRLDVGVVPAVVFIAFGIGILASVVAATRSGAREPALVESDPDRSPESEV